MRTSGRPPLEKFLGFEIGREGRIGQVTLPIFLDKKTNEIRIQIHVLSQATGGFSSVVAGVPDCECLVFFRAAGEAVPFNHKVSEAAPAL